MLQNVYIILLSLHLDRFSLLNNSFNLQESLKNDLIWEYINPEWDLNQRPWYLELRNAY